MSLVDHFKKSAVNYLRGRAVLIEYVPYMVTALGVFAPFIAPEVVPFMPAMKVLTEVGGPIERKFLNDLADHIERGEDLNLAELLSNAFKDLKEDIDKILPEIEKLSPEAAKFLRKLFSEEGSVQGRDIDVRQPLLQPA